MRRSSENRTRLLRAAFTLIEMMASMTLLAVLVAALSGIVPGIVRQTNRLPDSRTAETSWKREVLTRLSDDLLTAEQATASSHELKLIGLFGRDPKTGVLNDTPAALTYRLEACGDRTALFVECGGQSRLLAVGELGLQLERLAGNRESGSRGELRAPGAVQTPAKAFPLSAQMRVSVVDRAGVNQLSQVVLRQPVLAVSAPKETP